MDQRTRRCQLTRLANPILTAAIKKGLRPERSTSTDAAYNEQEGRYRGYYMRVGHRPETFNYWIASNLQDARARVDRAGDLFLSDTHGYEYDIEFSYGAEATGGSPWGNYLVD